MDFQKEPWQLHSKSKRGDFEMNPLVPVLKLVVSEALVDTKGCFDVVPSK